MVSLVLGQARFLCSKAINITKGISKHKYGDLWSSGTGIALHESCVASKVKGGQQIIHFNKHSLH